jgi:lysozyme family protein
MTAGLTGTKWDVDAAYLVVIMLLVWLLAGCDQQPTAYKTGKPPPTPSAPISGGGSQVQRWKNAKIKVSSEIAVNKAVMLYLRTKDRYETVEKMRRDGVPAPVIFCLHYRESSNSFKAHLHEGSSLLHRTRYVPRGRLPSPNDPPYTWEASAEDAIYTCDRLQGPWRDTKWSLDKMEAYNGLGYRKLGVPSPYLYAGTTVYEKGKYTSDGHYNSEARDQQLGCVAILKKMKERGVPIKFS